MQKLVNDNGEVNMTGNMNPPKNYTTFDSEVVPHISALKRYAFKMTKNYDESNDLLQDTLLKAYRFYKNYSEGSNAKAWLFKIMQNSYINNYRERIKEPIKIDYDDVQNFYESIKSEEVKVAHYQPDAFCNLMDDEVIEAFTILPDAFRTVVILSDIEGYTYKEISDFVDCPVGTVRSRLHRARKILYVLLYEYAQKKNYIGSAGNRTSKSEKKDDIQYQAL